MNPSHYLSIEDFQRDPLAVMKQVQESRQPAFITENGRVRAVALDPATYEELKALQEKGKPKQMPEEGGHTVVGPDM